VSLPNIIGQAYAEQIVIAWRQAVTELLAFSVFAVASLLLARRSVVVHGGGSHSKYPITIDRGNAFEPKHRHRGVGHLSSLVRYIATGTGPYEPPK